MNGDQINSVNGPVNFYFDDIYNVNGTTPPICPGNNINQVKCPSYDNISFIGAYTLTSTVSFNQILQFSGNLHGEYNTH